MRRNNNGVSGFQRDQAFENCGRSWISSWNYRSDNTYRFSDLFYAESLILFNYTAGFGVFIGIINILGSIVIFDNFIFNNAHSGFFNSKFCKGNSRFVGSRSGGKKNFIDLFLSIGRKNLLCFLSATDSLFKLFNAVYDLISRILHNFPPDHGCLQLYAACQNILCVSPYSPLLQIAASIILTSLLL